MMLGIKAVLLAAALLAFDGGQAIQLEPENSWTRAISACIIGNNDQIIDEVYAFSDCQNHCQIETGFSCKSVEYHRSGRCVLSVANRDSHSHSYIQPCHDNGWIFSEVNVRVSAHSQVCNTLTPCGKKGGFCIGVNEHCRDNNTIKGQGYCTNNPRSCKCCLTSTVYMRDIENTIAYVLRKRAPFEYSDAHHLPSSYRNLNRTEQEVLSNFSQALINHLPSLRSDVMNFLICLGAILPKSTILNGSELKNIYQDCEKKGELPDVTGTSWIGCSKTNDHGYEQIRSYPCGIWTTFHAMSVNLNDEDASKLLQTLHGLVNYFPWCESCQSHFLKMYNGNVNRSEIQTGIISDMFDGDANGFKPATDMKTANNVTMWLWSAHNIVNSRVINEETNFTNIGRSQLQFPGIEQCPTCFKPQVFNSNHQIFNRMEVLSYIRTMYNQIV